VTNPATESRSQNQPNSELRLDVYLFNCGHGDTILVRLPDGRWGMVDCYLPETGGVRDRFFQFVQRNKIKTLEFVFQTHPHEDHFHGMEAVLDFFVDSSQLIGAYYDTGLNDRFARSLLYKSPMRGEYFLLQDKLRQLYVGKKLLKWEAMAAGHSPVGTGRSGMERIEFLPVGPDSADQRLITCDGLRRLADNPNARTAANALSLIIAMSAKQGDQAFNMLLGADAEVAALEKAFQFWSIHCTANHRPAAFNTIKVPHHGSGHSHHPQICAKRASSTPVVAAISAGVREALPDRNVLAAYLAAGWDVVSTTTHGPPATQLPMQLADRSSSVQGPRTHLIQITWQPGYGLTVIPLEASIRTENLPSYETAKR
jgi:beta-lactamase superfamily II metal-dependent hydrolase